MSQAQEEEFHRALDAARRGHPTEVVLLDWDGVGDKYGHRDPDSLARLRSHPVVRANKVKFGIISRGSARRLREPADALGATVFGGDGSILYDPAMRVLRHGGNLLGETFDFLAGEIVPKIGGFVVSRLPRPLANMVAENAYIAADLLASTSIADISYRGSKAVAVRAAVEHFGARPRSVLGIADGDIDRAMLDEIGRMGGVGVVPHNRSPAMDAYARANRQHVIDHPLEYTDCLISVLGALERTT